MPHIDLEKAKESLRLNLEKRGVHTLPSADLAFVLDVSGSFNSTHQSGITQKLLERLVPWGMLFDPDQKLDVFTFSDGESSACHVGDITPTTCDDYIQKKIIGKVEGYNGGTEYGHVITKVLQNFGWLPVTDEPAKKAGFFGKLLGQKDQPSVKVQLEKRRSIILFVTDGDNSDKSECEEILDAAEKRGDETYFLFLAIGHAHFPFLKDIADLFSNTGLVEIKDIKKFVAMSNDELNDLLIGEELITWLKK